jgi:UDP-N-acetylmuramate dehydrogenase
LRSGEPPAGVQADVPLAPLTTLGVGGRARWFVRATTIEQVAAADAWCRGQAVSLCVIGGGSNLVIADAGIAGLVMQVAIGGMSFSARGDVTTLRLGAGEPWDPVVAACVTEGLSGLECLSGIPGSAGGTPVQNVGAYGQEVSDAIAEVTVFDRQCGEVGGLGVADCEFGYRTSRFKGNHLSRFVVCEVVYALRRESPTVIYPDLISQLERRRIRVPTLADVRDVVLSIRRRKGMVLDALDVDTRSVGSFFVNPVVDARRHAEMASLDGPVPGFPLPGDRVKIPAAWLIENAGFSKGHSAGRVGLSSKHPLAIVNRGAGTAREVVALARRVKEAVADRFDVKLRPEPTFLGFGDDADVAYLLDDATAEVTEIPNRL